VDEHAAEMICRVLYKGGCRSVHIGGGEPFLNFDGLLLMIRKLKQAGIKLDYIETNAYWTAERQNQKEIIKKLKRLLAEGANCLCISLDPFHAEYIPYGAPLALAELCDKTGMGYFVWKHEYLSVLSQLDPINIHSRQEMENAISKDYIFKTARQYGISYGGRAVNIEREMYLLQDGKLTPAQELVKQSSPCKNLLSTGHFHVDMNCCFIPPGCTGIIIPLEEAVCGIPDGKYPAFEALYNGGVSSLWELALGQGFAPDSSGYPSKCNLCFYLRSFLSGRGFAELDADHYIVQF
jgi:organic radical activating enzyme